PTKVPPYLISNTPIIAYGSNQVAQIKYALDHEWAHVVDKRDLKKLEKDGLIVIADSGKISLPNG
ncbi:MAG: hypothetical protein VXV73_03625, partial [Actinomycetota bacterium]|nr:hypothetical protein [Actinomycetota bacterium]